MAKLRLDVEQWGSILDALEEVPTERRRPCHNDAIVEIRTLLRDVAAARREIGDPRDAFAHDCAQAGCATCAAERDQVRGDQEQTLGPAALRLLEAEFGEFFLVVRLDDGKLAVIAQDVGDKLLKNVVKAAQGWVDAKSAS